MPELSGFNDHFSGHAGSYAAHRPGYPDPLFRAIADACVGHELAWDCATGNGQAARSLLPHFDAVIATDASEQQIRSAEPREGITFRVARAESSGLDPASADLVTVAQAIHWFDIDAFFAEAGRVLKPGGVIAFWCYQWCSVDPACDEVISDIIDDVEDYWPPERDIIERGYVDITMPFEEIHGGEFEMRVTWSMEQLLAYVSTWSASRRYLAEIGRDPVVAHSAPMRRAWGEGTRSVTWPLVLRMGRR